MMCSPPSLALQTKNYRRQSETVLLISENSYYCVDEKGEKGPLPPSKASVCLTLASIVALITASEHIWRHLIGTYFLNWSTLLQVETNRQILARHIGVDTFCCAVVSYWGVSKISYISDLPRHVFGWQKSSSKSVDNNDAPFDSDDIDSRIYKYHPFTYRILMFFLAFQIKNSYDTIVWNDGPEFLFHHILAGGTAIISMYFCLGHYYCVFFMGVSEVSTGILCLLANFDAEHGVKGLDKEYPITRLLLAGLFVVSFLICRTILWPIYARQFWIDVKNANERNSIVDNKQNLFYLRITALTCAGLSILQVIWLGEIFRLGYLEIVRLG